MFLVVGLAPLLLFGAYLSWYTFTVHKRQIVSQHKALAKLAAENISLFFHEQIQVVNTHIKEVYQGDRVISDLDLELRKLIAISADKKHRHVINSAWLIDSDGRQAGYASRAGVIAKDEHKDYLTEEVFKFPYTTGTDYFSSVYLDEKTGEPLAKLSMPVKDLFTGSIRYVLVVEMRLKAIWDTLANLNHGESGKAYVVDKNGLVVAHSNPSVVFRKTYFTLPGKAGVAIGLSGEKSFIAASKINFAGDELHAVVEQPVAEAYQYYYRTLIAIAGFVVVSLMGAFVVGGYVVRDLVDPVESLAKTAKEVSAGGFDKKTDIHRDDEIGGLASAFDSMTDRLVGALEIVENERSFLNDVIESFAYPLYVLDVEDPITRLCNASAKYCTDGDLIVKAAYSPRKRSSDTGMISPIEEIRQSRKPVSLVYRKDDGDDAATLYELHGYPVLNDDRVSQVIWYAIDVTEKRQLEEQLRQSQKMEALGRLASGVAHDFNNLLTAIIGYSELSLAKLPEGTPVKKWLEVIRESGEIGAAFTNQLLVFSRRQHLSTKVINPVDILDRISGILQRLAGRNVELRIDQGKAVGNICADESQIEQIFINIAVNAKDAMPSGGVLQIRMEDVQIQPSSDGHGDIPPGHYVHFQFKDNGVGMTDEVMSRIFEPFFTTKGDKGNGLGLATVYGIIKQHNGFIDVKSSQGKGTVFHIYLPVTDKLHEYETVTDSGQEYSGTETILVVDDDINVRGFLKDSLSDCGYEVYTASTISEAFAQLREDAGVDLLVAGNDLEGVDETALTKEVMAISPMTKVLFMIDDRHGADVEIEADAIYKPIRLEALQMKIRQLMA